MRELMRGLVVMVVVRGEGREKRDEKPILPLWHKRHCLMSVHFNLMERSHYYMQPPASSIDHYDQPMISESYNNLPTDSIMNSLSSTPPSSSSPKSWPSTASTVSTLKNKKPRKLKRVGRGTFGQVFMVPTTGGVLAKKIISPDDQNGLCISAIRECTMLNTFQHPFILPIKNIILNYEGQIEIFMPLARYDLDLLIYRHQHENRHLLAVNTMWRILKVLQCLHAHHLIHRDIKPSNILVDKFNQVFLADYGSARFMMDEYPLPPTTDTTNTTPTNTTTNTTTHTTPTSLSASSNMPDFKHHRILLTKNMITYPYRPPELSHDAYTTKADIYSLGCTIIHLITGEYPYTREEIPPFPEQWKTHFQQYLENYPLFPSVLKETILSMIQDDPHTRPSAHELLQAEIFRDYHLINDPFNPAYEYLNEDLHTMPRALELPPHYDQRISEDDKKFCFKLCQKYKMPLLVYITVLYVYDQFTGSSAYHDKFDEPDEPGEPELQDLKCAMVGCFLVVGKFYSDDINLLRKLHQISHCSVSEIKKMEMSVFLFLNFKIPIFKNVSPVPLMM